MRYTRHMFLKLQKIRNWQIGCLLIVLSFVLYGRAITYEFVWDDIRYINQFEQIEGFSISSWLQGTYPWGTTGYYRPVRNIFDFIYHVSFGNNASGYHLVPIIYNGLISYLVFLVADQLLDKRVAIVATLLFVSHPIHVEAVAWVSPGLDLIYVVFYLLSLFSFVLFRKRKQKNYFVYSLVFCFLALFSNEMTVSLPVVIVLYDLLIEKQKFRKNLAYYVYYGYLLAGWFVIRSYLSAPTGEQLRIYESVYETGLLVLVLLGKHLSMLTFPIGLSVDHVLQPGINGMFRLDHRIDTPVPRINVFYPKIAIALGGVTGYVSGLIWSLKQKKDVIAVLLLWMGVSLIPVLRVIPIPILYQERHSYLASVPFCILLGYLLTRLFKKKNLLVVVALIVCFYSILSWQRIPDWENQITLWEKTYAQNPQSTVAAYSLARAYYDQGEVEKAEPFYEKTWELNPFVKSYQVGLLDYYRETGQHQKELDYFLFFLERQPEDVEIVYAIGQIYENKITDPDKALEYYQLAHELAPADTEIAEALERVESQL